jgi:hypothetical protein
MDFLSNFDWAALVPIVILLTALIKNAGIFKNMDDRIINLIAGAVVIGVVYLLPFIGVGFVELGLLESMFVVLVNPLVYDKWIKPFLDYFFSNVKKEG